MPIETLWPYGRQGSSPICSNSAHPSLFWPSDIWQKATSWRCSSRKLFVHKRDLEPGQQFHTQITIQNHSYSPPNLQHWDEFRPRLWGLTKSFQQITPITWWRSSTPEQGKNRESAWCQGGSCLGGSHWIGERCSVIRFICDPFDDPLGILGIL